MPGTLTCSLCRRISAARRAASASAAARASAAAARSRRAMAHRAAPSADGPPGGLDARAAYLSASYSSRLAAFSLSRSAWFGLGTRFGL